MNDADAAVRDVLRSQWHDVPAVRLDSPPGAGKTGVVERLAAQSLGVLGERCMIATQTNEQAFDLARRLAERYRKLTFTLFVKRELALPDDLARCGNLIIVRNEADLPDGPCVVIANAHKWIWVRDPLEFHLLIVDEAFQLPDFRFHQLAGFARRVVLIGDPGQIPPIVTCDIDRWKSNQAGPHVAAPLALTHRHPDVLRLKLPVSRRLMPDTVRFVQPAFYPDLPFQAFSKPGDRRLTAETGTGQGIDAVIDVALAGASIVSLELPEDITSQSDPVAADAIATLIIRLKERKGRVVEDGHERLLRPSDVGVVCAHVSQVTAVTERMPPELSDILVETADRYQGLERDVMVVHHPLSGRADASEFHMDVGRLCVMLTRHRVACFVVSRGGVEGVLQRYKPNADRVLNIEKDREFAGWRAHSQLLGALRAERRMIPVLL